MVRDGEGHGGAHPQEGGEVGGVVCAGHPRWWPPEEVFLAPPGEGGGAGEEDGTQTQKLKL